MSSPAPAAATSASASASASSAASAAASSPLNRHSVSALEELTELSPLYQRSSLELLGKILAAVVAAPADPKYRRVNSAKLRPKLRTNAALKLLESVGFIPQEGDQEEFMTMEKEPSAEQIHILQIVQEELKKIVAASTAASTPPDAAASADSAAAAAAAASSPAAAAAAAASSAPLILAPRQLIPAEGDTIEDATHVLFWRPPGFLGQWTMVDFVIDGVRYVCPEQWMMASKARLFGDHATFARIMTSASPRDHKKLGRAVSPFDSKVWEDNCLRIVEEGNYAKFTQHTAFGKRLLATGNKTIVEATPLDPIWGVAMAASDPDIRDKSKWRGKNLLGEALMRVRARMQKELEQSTQKA